jgi:hypothetical protein
MGAGVPASVLQPQEEKKDLSGMFKYYNAPDFVREMYEEDAINLEMAYTMTMNEAGKTPENMTDEDWGVLYEAGVIDEKEFSPKLASAMTKAYKYFGKKTMDAMAPPVVDQRSPMDIVMDDLYKKIDQQGLTYETMTPRQRALIDKRHPDKESKNFVFGVDYDTADMLALGRKVIAGEKQTLWPFDYQDTNFNNNITSWMADSKEFEEGKKKEYLTKYYDPTTGTFKEDALLKRADTEYRIMKRLAKKLSLTDLEKEIFDGIIARTMGFVKQEEWDRIEQDEGRSSMLKIQRAYNDYVNGKKE